MITTFRHTIAVLLLLVTFTATAQQHKTVASGYITFNSGSNFEFKDMVIEGDSVSYFNPVTQTRMNFKLNAVKKIVDNTGATVYDAVNTAVSKGVSTPELPVVAVQHDTLVYKSGGRLFVNKQELTQNGAEQLFKQNPEAYTLYTKWRKNNEAGNVLIGGGLGFAGGWVLGTVIASGNAYGSGPGVALGLLATIIGVPIKLSAPKHLKMATWKYNHDNGLAQYFNNAELKFTAGAGTVGMQVRF